MAFRTLILWLDLRRSRKRRKFKRSGEQDSSIVRLLTFFRNAFSCDSISAASQSGLVPVVGALSDLPMDLMRMASRCCSMVG